MKRKKPGGLCCKTGGKKGKEKKGREKKREPDENWQPTVSVMPSPLPLVELAALKCQLASCKHSSPLQQPLPRKLSLLNSCVIAGPGPERGCLVLGGVGQVGGVVNKGDALLWDEHCYTDKVVKEEMALCYFVIHQQNRIHPPLWACSTRDLTLMVFCYRQIHKVAPAFQLGAHWHFMKSESMNCFMQ